MLPSFPGPSQGSTRKAELKSGFVRLLSAFPFVSLKPYPATQTRAKRLCDERVKPSKSSAESERRHTHANELSTTTNGQRLLTCRPSERKQIATRGSEIAHGMVMVTDRHQQSRAVRAWHLACRSVCVWKQKRFAVLGFGCSASFRRCCHSPPHTTRWLVDILPCCFALL